MPLTGAWADRGLKRSSRSLFRTRGMPLCCRAALQGAALNVFINTKLMKDRVLAEEYQKRADRMLQEYVPVADRIYEKVLEEIH